MPITEARREYLKQYRQDNKERIAKRDKKYYENNKEEIAVRIKKWKLENKDKIIETNKEYRKTPAGKKPYTIYRWKTRGLICNDYDALYNQYIYVTNCDNCFVTFGKIGDQSGTHKCMDHCHETGAFRNFLCHRCNLRRG